MAALAAGGASGAEPTREELAQARVRFEQGQRLFDLRRYLEAVPEFEAAYRLSGDPVFLYNIAQSYRLAERRADAIHYYEIFLKRVPDTPRREEVERRIRELRQVTQPPNQVDEGPRAEPERPSVAAAPPSPAAHAAAAAPPPHAHDRLLVRGLVGGGVLAMGAKLGGQRASAGGAAGMLLLDLGWAFRERWAVHGGLFGSAVSEPRVTYGAFEGSAGGPLGLQGIGAGGSWFHTGRNLYLSGSLLVVRGALDRRHLGGGRRETSAGGGLLLLGGKEWWVARDLGIGAALYLHLGSMRDEGAGTAPTWSSFAGGIAFSATYN